MPEAVALGSGLGSQARLEGSKIVTDNDDKDKPINIRFRENKTDLTIRLKPRSYQDELYKIALRENVVIFLGTGLGKTFITVLHINSPQVDQEIQNGRKVAFIATTQDLIKQQADYINRQTPYRVKIFCGRTAHCGEHIDHWNESTWLEELKKVDLLFMTPQIFCNAISTNLINWNQFALVIFDEFHHAGKPKSGKSGSPYRNVLLHYQSVRHNLITSTRLVGLTASLINSMPRNREDIKFQVADLERLISGRCITNIEVLESKPTMIMHSYCDLKYTPENDFLTRIFTNWKKKLDDVLKNKKMTGDKSELAKIQTYHVRLLLAARGLSIKPGSFPKIFEGLKIVRQRCGIWALEAICARLVEALDKPWAQSCMSADTKGIYAAYTSLIQELGYCLQRVLRPLHGEEALLSYASDKPLCLLDILKREYRNFQTGSNQKDSFSCIIFVRSRLEVTALCQWLQNVSAILPEYSFIKCDYAIGLAATMASKYACITKRKPAEQSKMLENFRNGNLNVIVTTSVLEEGIDLPVCSTVIRYDLPNNFREYVQSRGRARQKVSSFVSVCMNSKQSEEELKYNKLNDFEITLKEDIGDHDIRNLVVSSNRQTGGDQGLHSTDRSLHEVDVYEDPAHGVRIPVSGAKTILQMYCYQLSRNTPFSEEVLYDRVEFLNKQYQTTIKMPSGCPLEGPIVGNIKSSKHNADNSAVIAVLRALINAKELSPKGVPFRVNEENLENLLDKHNLKPIYEPLPNDDQFGISEEEKTHQYFKHKPRARTINDYISKEFRNKAYHLVPIRFVAADSNVRRETQHLMEAQVFGLIFDSTIDTSFMPEYIYTHYGKFEVLFGTRTMSHVITNPDHHKEFLNYTHKLSTRCLGITHLRLEEFRCHCQLYVVPLDKESLPDQRQMSRSFTTNYNMQTSSALARNLRQGDIVKLRQFCTRDTNKLFLVRAIRRDMYPRRSYIPGRRGGITFEQDAKDRYDRLIIDINHPIIEVMPLSSEYGRTDAGKKRSADYTTQSLYYLVEFLEFFSDDAALVIQSFQLPEIFYKLYQHVTTNELDQIFLSATKEYRAINDEPMETDDVEIDALVVAGVVEQASTEENPEEKDDNEAVPTQSDPTSVPEDNPDQENGDDGDGDDENDDATGSSENGSESDIDNPDLEVDQDDTDYDSDTEINRNYQDMILAKRLDLNADDDSEDKLEKWDFDNYEQENLVQLEFVRRESRRPYDLSLEPEARLGYVFTDLEQRVEPLMQELVKQLEDYELKVLENLGSYEEEAEFDNAQLTVNRSIECPIKFDDASKPIRELSSRTLCLLEALTLKKASQRFSLEALENVGDSYLKYLTSVVIYQNVEGSEGILTSVRSRLICNKHFTYLARKMKLGTYVIDKPFSKERLAYALGQDCQQDQEAALLNRLKSKDLADMFESIVGSYLVYHGEFEAILALKWLGMSSLNETTFAELSSKRVKLAQPTSDLDNVDIESVTRTYKSKISRVEKILGYKFNNPVYLVQALTHASDIHKSTRSYQRLEFLGDAILDFLTTVTLFQTGLITTPGQMTASRSALVNNAAFARLSLKYNFDRYLLHFNHEICDELEKVRLTLEDDPSMSFFDLIDYDGIVKLLGDLFESIAGAIFLDSGCSLDAVWSIYYPIMKDDIEKELKEPSKNLASLLYETFTGKGRITFEVYDVKTDAGNRVGVDCKIVGFGLFKGVGLTRSQAKKRAIQAAMANPPSEEQKKRLNQEYLATLPPNPNRGQSSSGRGRSGRGASRGGRQGRGRGRGQFGRY